MKYEYRVEEEDFKRVDNRGRPLKINISEARQIESLRTLGYPVSKIYEKIEFNKDVSITTLRTFIKNMESGNISLEGDYPAPVHIKKDMDLEARLCRIEESVKRLEKSLDECKCDKQTDVTNSTMSFNRRVKEWLRQ